MLSIRPGDASTVSREDDRAWRTAVTLVIAPHPGLPPAQRKVIELEYGRDDGEADSSVGRHCFSTYSDISGSRGAKR